MSYEFVTLKSLALREGDTVVTPKGTFVVLDRSELLTIRVVWLETQRRAGLWLEDEVYGPVDVHRNVT